MISPPGSDFRTVSVDRPFIPLMVPNITEADIEAVAVVLRSGMLVSGSNVAALEARTCEFMGVPYASALSNGTVTLDLALTISGIGAGDEVIVPAFSYMATANVVEHVGARPIFVDINAATFNIDPTLIEAAITPRTKAIIPVHEFGMSAPMDAIMSIAEKHGLIVIEDAACALGATIGGRFAGSYGRFASFSLHPRKAITSGEGGLLVCANAGDAEQIAILRNHGVQMQDGVMEFVANGYNYRLTDFQAALVLSQMARLEDIIAYKNELAQIYLTSLRGLPLRLPDVPDGYRHTWQTFHTVVPDSMDRDGLIAQLKTRGIGANYGAQCMPYMQVFQKKYGLDCVALFPHALRAYKQGLALPLYDKMSVDDVSYVAETFAELIRH